MPSVSVKIEGLEQLQHNFRKSPEIVRSAFSKAIDKAMLGIEAAAKPITPIDKGILVNSIFSKLYTDKVGGEVATGPEAPYAEYVHDGTEQWPLSSPPKNPTRVRQFFLKAAEMTEVDRNRLWSAAAREVAEQLAQ